MRGQMSIDVAIVGAGAAGLAAAGAIRDRGLSFVVLEAMNRIGGRAHTDVETFGVPWDRGCHWLHSADINPLTALADRYGFRYSKAVPSTRFHFGDRVLAGESAAEVRRYIEECWAQVEAAGEAGKDIPASDVIDPSHPWIAAFRTAAAGEWSLPIDQISTLDDVAYRDTGHNWPMRDGLGALVARHAEGIPVSLATPVERIAWGGKGVRLTTQAGTVEAQAVIVTVSPRIIQDGVIAFDPPLPVWKQEAFDAIQLGNANKVTFAIDGRLLGVEEHSTLWVKVTERQGMFFQLRPFGWDLANGYLAGELGTEAEREGPAAIIETGMTALKTAFGNDIVKHVTKSACTTWQSEPWIRGAYSAARPGLAHKRKDLVTPIDGKLFWAGEAVSTEFFSTCHGAHLTGIAAAEAVACALRAPGA